MVIGPELSDIDAQRLGEAGMAVIVAGEDAGRCGELAAIVVAAGGRAATFTGSPEDRTAIEAMGAELFGRRVT